MGMGDVIGGYYRVTGDGKEPSGFRLVPALHVALDMPVTLIGIEVDREHWQSWRDALVSRLKVAPLDASLLRVTDVVIDDGLWLVAEAGVIGTIADELPPAAPLDWARLVDIALPWLSGLSWFHQSGHVHGSPDAQHVFRLEDGSCKLAPFSIASITASDQALSSVYPGLLWRFASPERAQGMAVRDPSTDVFEAATGIFELCAGRALWPETDEQTLIGLVTRIVVEPIDLEPLEGRKGQLPERFIDCLRRCLARNVDERPQDAAKAIEQMGLRLANPFLAERPVPAPGPPGPGPLPPEPLVVHYGPPPPWILDDEGRKSRLPWLLLGLAVAASGGFALWHLW